MSKSKKVVQHVFRSAKTGQFVTGKKAKRCPSTTVSEAIKKPRHSCVR